MIFNLGKIEEENIGNKAKYLSIMKKEGFNVPFGIVIDNEEFLNILKENGKDEEFRKIIKDGININKLKEIIEELKFPEKLIEKIYVRLDSSKKYAIRSSASKEDLKDSSFAGQYETILNVKIKNRIELENAMKKCYVSLYQEKVINYCNNKKISLASLEMNIIIQEMIEAEYSGVLFGANPVNGNDREMLIEVAKGLGENVVNGKVVPNTYIYDTNKKRFIKKPKLLILNEDILENLLYEAKKLQVLLGFPIDMEFAILNHVIYFLQVRQITKFGYTLDSISWTNANFKDGGVSSEVCTPYMWSLYKMIWENSLRAFFLNIKILKENEIDHELGKMFFSRPYFNVSIIKKAMERIPGYVERDFDHELGITPLYEGIGKVSKVHILSLYRLIIIRFCLKRLQNNIFHHSKVFFKQQKEVYQRYREENLAMLNDEQFFSIFEKLIQEDFYKNDTTYFTQIYINTIEQTLLKRKVKKYVNKQEYLDLISGIDNISHMRPFYDIWDIVSKIKKDKEILEYFWNTDVDEMYDTYIHNRKSIHIFDDISIFIRNYEYHSFRELNLLYPRYAEDIKGVLSMIKENLKLDEEHSPSHDKLLQKEKHKQAMETLKHHVGERKFKRIRKQIYFMRDLLWFREELKDFSTRFYYLIRLYTLEAGQRLKNKGVIQEIDDIFYLTKDNIFDYFKSKKGTEKLKELVKENKTYFNSFRNYVPENEIGNFSYQKKDKEDEITLVGIGCSSGKITSKARVIEDFSQIDKINNNEILVTRFTDTGWTSKFGKLSGIVTQNGGMLCHLAIAAREYGIPCIVSVENVMSKIKDGDRITIDGASGEIVIEDREE